VFEGDTFGFMLVFELSSRCNLKCVYCNANAGPLGDRPVLDPQIFEKWVEAFGFFSPSILSIQLHGGEPLIVDPPVELYAAIARNTLGRFPKTKLGYLGVQSNGSALNERRASSLEAVGLSIDISIDGPASIHDRRRSAPGRSNHREAMRAHHLLRARRKYPGVIAVACDPQDVVPAIEFFLEDGFREVRMNVLRPEGRGLQMRQWDDPSVMRDMAWEYFSAAKIISEHNRHHPAAPFFEFNLASLMQILTGESKKSDMIYWSFLIDDRGRLWSHPCGFYGSEGLRLTDHGAPSPDSLSHILGLAKFGSSSRAGVAAAIRQRLAESSFAPCPECKSQDFCVPVYGRRNNADHKHPVCVWTSTLMTHLANWLEDDPAAARRIVPRSSRAIGNDTREVAASA
jgi:sulfatase maturation enzyme AslB (radical SAM superfamily)